ncbi:MAG: hypothetical protein KBT01_03175, partial [Clostridiales bacterium]|nr:hypothetical protein [Candidatus Blautia equi]
MLALLYILISVLIGREVTELFLLRRVRETTGNRFWLLFPMAFGSGTLIVTWLVYAAAYIVEKITADRHPLFIANLIILLLSVLYLCIVYVWRKKTGRKLARKNWIQEERLFRKELIFFALLFLFILYMMFYVFRIKDGYLWAGFTVFSDYAPHTSMIRSFSVG